MSRIIGIDLGTTNSVVAFLDEGGPRLIPNALGESLTPSVVGIDLDGKVVVGKTARELSVLHPDRTAALFKRYMGTDWTGKLVGRKFTPEELSSIVLRTLKDDAESFLGESISQAVITVPAYFNDQQRKATMNAGRIAGLKVERIINEPTAAALAYGLQEAQEEKFLLVFDLGGGTFDVSLVELFDGIVEVKSSSGETFLGGEDFTRRLVVRVLEKQGQVFERAELEAPKMVSRTLQQCELAKCKLSQEATAAVRIANKEGELNDDCPEISVSADDFHTWTESILNRIELPIRRVLGDANLKRSDIDEVILVGGATRMPQIVERVNTLFNKKPQNRLNPDEVVALGAAVQAGLVSQDENVEDLVVTDVAPFTLGIMTSKLFGSERRDGYFLPVIHRNTTIPVSRFEPVYTIYPNQTEIRVEIYQGESRRVENNLHLGEFTVKGIPRGPAGQAVDIRFTYDLNGVLEVEATVVETGKSFNHVVTRLAHAMTSEEIEEAVQKMQHLKTHPREESLNRFLLRRAERVYRELPMSLRHHLSEMLDGFEEALTLQQPDLIERYRESLERFLDQYDSGDEPDLWTPDDE